MDHGSSIPPLEKGDKPTGWLVVFCPLHVKSGLGRGEWGVGGTSTARSGLPLTNNSIDLKDQLLWPAQTKGTCKTCSPVPDRFHSLTQAETTEAIVTLFALSPQNGGSYLGTVFSIMIHIGLFTNHLPTKIIFVPCKPYVN
ncbi:hypothetical protein RRG08_015306 [Elysia crispata]|uniref:Uncharacterized protein n=1 Tax=Elysia crispata TaxID=231223 RepID=A0AAE0ZTU8_9GAST|nr:hypothetical protein RRG08_015306 [Elysia crispata]